MISVPVGLLVISLAGTLYKGAITFETPMLYALGVLFLFLIGGLTGIPLALTSLTVHLSDTYYVVGHFHYVMAVAGTFAIFGGVFYWFPKITGRMYNEFWGKLGFWTHVRRREHRLLDHDDVGVRKGMPRRYYDYSPNFRRFESAQHWMTVGAAILGRGVS
jgi:cytochrome c oxidase subunit 1